MFRLFVGLVVALAFLVVVSNASASGYTMSLREARAATADAAETKYARFGVDVKRVICGPQFVNRDSNWRKYEWHRWKCGWVGFDGNMDVVYGFFRITGHSDGTYGYLHINGGLQWQS